MQNEQALQPQRQPYASPSLATLGSVRDLTAGGSLGIAETKCKVQGEPGRKC